MVTSKVVTIFAQILFGFRRNLQTSGFLVPVSTAYALRSTILLAVGPAVELLPATFFEVCICYSQPSVSPSARILLTPGNMLVGSPPNHTNTTRVALSSSHSEATPPGRRADDILMPLATIENIVVNRNPKPLSDIAQTRSITCVYLLH